MGKSFSAIDVKTVLQKLGIRRHLFMKQVEAQTRIYEEIVNAEQASLRKVDEALKRSLRHLDRAHAKLCIDALSEEIGSGLSDGRLGSELTKALKEGRFYGIPKCARAVRRASIRVDTCRRNLRHVVGGRRQRRAAVSTCIAASKLESAIRAAGLKKMGYHGALCLHALGYEPRPPKSTSKLDPAVNRFWTSSKRGKEILGTD